MSPALANLFTPRAAAKHEHLFKKLAYVIRGWFVEQKLMLRSSFRRSKFDIVRYIILVTLLNVQQITLGI